jgi:aspartyl protease family protein
VEDILRNKLTKRNVDVRYLDVGDVQKMGGDKVKQVIKVRNGIESEQAKKIQRLIKDSKLKVQAAIQGDAVRVTGAKRDDLQAAMALIKKDISDFPLSSTTSATDAPPAFVLLACLLLPFAALAQSVALQGMMGNRALLIIDGSAPRGVAPGDTHQGVKVLSTTGDEAVVEIGGKRHTLRVGDAPASVGGSGPRGGNRIVLTAGSGGHFFSQGAINGRAVQFMVDTGATAVSMGLSDARRLGVPYESRPAHPDEHGQRRGARRGWCGWIPCA